MGVEKTSKGTALNLGLNKTYRKGFSGPTINIKASLKMIQPIPSNVNVGQTKSNAMKRNTTKYSTNSIKFKMSGIRASTCGLST